MIDRRQYCKEWNARNKERVKKQRRERYLKRQDIELAMGKKWREEHPKRIRELATRRDESFKKYRDKHPQKLTARGKLGKAILGGKILREPCIMCGTTENVHAHHNDYSKPLEVVWMCAFHHGSFHRCVNRYGDDGIRERGREDR